METTELFEDALKCLQQYYKDSRFFAERDIVWTVQLRLLRQIEEDGLPYRVFNDHRILTGALTDLAILNGDSIEVAAEFKYEPSHDRSINRGGDIRASKLSPSVVFWTAKGSEGSVEKDVQRVQEYVKHGKVKVAYSIFIDEGGHFRHRDPHPGSEWRDWGAGIWVLWSRAS